MLRLNLNELGGFLPGWDLISHQQETNIRLTTPQRSTQPKKIYLFPIAFFPLDLCSTASPLFSRKCVFFMLTKQSKPSFCIQGLIFPDGPVDTHAHAQKGVSSQTWSKKLYLINLRTSPNLHTECQNTSSGCLWTLSPVVRSVFLIAWKLQENTLKSAVPLFNSTDFGTNPSPFLLQWVKATKRTLGMFFCFLLSGPLSGRSELFSSHSRNAALFFVHCSSKTGQR